jgi:hypothetical protein
MAVDDFVMTIDSDDEELYARQAPKSKINDPEAVQLDLDFVFDPSGDPYSDALEARTELKDYIKKGSRPVCTLLFVCLNVMEGCINRNLFQSTI